MSKSTQAVALFWFLSVFVAIPVLVQVLNLFAGLLLTPLLMVLPAAVSDSASLVTLLVSVVCALVFWRWVWLQFKQSVVERTSRRADAA